MNEHRVFMSPTHSDVLASPSPLFIRGDRAHGQATRRATGSAQPLRSSSLSALHSFSNTAPAGHAAAAPLLRPMSIGSRLFKFRHLLEQWLGHCSAHCVQGTTHVEHDADGNNPEPHVLNRQVRLVVIKEGKDDGSTNQTRKGAAKRRALMEPGRRAQGAAVAWRRA